MFDKNVHPTPTLTPINNPTPDINFDEESGDDGNNKVKDIDGENDAY